MPVPSAMPVVSGLKAVKPSPDPAKAGYTFSYWSQDGSTAFNFATPITGNLSLTAIYQPD